MNTILSVIAGSRLYGTNHPDSDTDVRCVFGTANAVLLGMGPPSDQYQYIQPDGTDVQAWEIRKFLRMAAKGSFTALELLFAPDTSVAFNTPAGLVLREHREMFLTEKVRESLTGFVKSLSRELKPETESYKPFLHAIRVLWTVDKLYRTGMLNFRLHFGPQLRNECAGVWADPSRREECIDEVREWQGTIAALPAKFPAEVDPKKLNDLLLLIRKMENE